MAENIITYSLGDDIICVSFRQDEFFIYDSSLRNFILLNKEQYEKLYAILKAKIDAED